MSESNEEIPDLLVSAIEVFRKCCNKCHESDMFPKYQIRQCRHNFCCKCIIQMKKCQVCGRQFTLSDIEWDKDAHIFNQLKELENIIIADDVRSDNVNPGSNLDIISVNKIDDYVDNIDSYGKFNPDCRCTKLYHIYHVTELSMLINKKRENNKTVVYIACEKSSTRVVRTLIESGADINVMNEFAFTPLHIAVYKGKIATVKLLLKTGAYMSNSKHLGYLSALHIACYYNYLKAIKLLMEYGANMNSEFSQITPYDIGSYEAKRIMRRTKVKHNIDKNISKKDHFIFALIIDQNVNISKNLDNFYKLKQFFLSEKITRSVTHVIVNSTNRMIPLSYRFLVALVNRIPVVTYEWLNSCETLNVVHDYTEYYVIGTLKYQWHIVNQSQISRFLHEKNVFQGFKIYLNPAELFYKMGDFQLCRKHLATLLKCGGAKILRKNPLRNKKPIQECNNNYIKAIIYTPKDPNNTNKCCKYLGRGIWFLPMHWVVLSILKQKALKCSKQPF